ncbi:MAG: hypothetical protein ACI8PG_003587 [Planctomycetota bacterium]|jgi:hypothetical protein
MFSLCLIEPINSAQVAYFRRNGFFLMENPLGAETVSTVDVEQRDVEKRWEEATFPQAFNRSACQFLMLGELLLKEVERPDFLAMARQLLDCEEVHIGACGKNHSD